MIKVEKSCFITTSLFCGFAVTTHKHALIEQSFERAFCARLVLSALLATHGPNTNRSPTKRGATSFGFIS